MRSFFLFFIFIFLDCVMYTHTNSQLNTRHIWTLESNVGLLDLD
jgi:hypothetical protein